MFDTVIEDGDLNENMLQNSEKNVLNGIKWIHNNIQTEILKIDETLSSNISDKDKALLLLKKSSLEEVLMLIYGNMKMFVRNSINEKEEEPKEENPSLIEDDTDDDLDKPAKVENEFEELEPITFEEIDVPEDIVKTCLSLESDVLDLLNLLAVWDKKYKEFYREQEQLFQKCGIIHGGEKTLEDFEKLYEQYPDFAKRAEQYIKVRDNQIQEFVERRGEINVKNIVAMLFAGKKVIKKPELLKDDTYLDDLSHLLNEEVVKYNKLSTAEGTVFEDFYGNAYNIFHKGVPTDLIKWLRSGLRIVKNSERL